MELTVENVCHEFKKFLSMDLKLGSESGKKQLLLKGRKNEHIKKMKNVFSYQPCHRGADII